MHFTNRSGDLNLDFRGFCLQFVIFSRRHQNFLVFSPQPPILCAKQCLSLTLTNLVKCGHNKCNFSVKISFLYEEWFRWKLITQKYWLETFRTWNFEIEKSVKIYVMLRSIILYLFWLIILLFYDFLMFSIFSLVSRINLWFWNGFPLIWSNLFK